MKRLVIASYFNSLPDPQREITWQEAPDDLFPLIDSVVKNGEQIRIFHDCFDNPPIIKNCEWIRVLPTTEYALTVYRWIVYYDYLQNLEYLPDSIFCVDSTDVEMLNNPFELIDDKTLYCGSDQDWKVKNRVLEKKGKIFTAPDYLSVLKENADQQMLNAGIIGGSSEVVLEFLQELVPLHERYSKNIKKSLDMPAFNYVILKFFSSRFITGHPIHTPFKREIYDQTCWWKHK